VKVKEKACGVTNLQLHAPLADLTCCYLVNRDYQSAYTVYKRLTGLQGDHAVSDEQDNLASIGTAVRTHW